MAKMSLAPLSPELTALADMPLDLTGKPNGLREAVVDFFRENGGEWEMRVQLCTDLETMPIEDASVRWPEKQSPYVAVARITVPPQVAWSDARSTAVDDGLAFNPWHGLAAHRPLGSIMRARKAVYETSARFRQQHNQHKVEEPRASRRCLTSRLPDAGRKTVLCIQEQSVCPVGDKFQHFGETRRRSLFSRDAGAKSRHGSARYQYMEARYSRRKSRPIVSGG